MLRQRDLVLRAVVANGEAGNRRAVPIVIAGAGCIPSAEVSRRRVVDRVVPVVVVGDGGPVPAAILILERRMVPFESGVGDANHDALARQPTRPQLRLRRSDLLNVQFDADLPVAARPDSRGKLSRSRSAGRLGSIVDTSWLATRSPRKLPNPLRPRSC